MPGIEPGETQYDVPVDEPQAVERSPEAGNEYYKKTMKRFQK